MNNEVAPPRVFVSYSHDSAEHKEWVLHFATTLRSRGVDAVLDQWDMQPGADLAHFMETELARCDYTLMICTDDYVQKANSGAGGVGFEKMIVTAQYLQKIDDRTIIPIIRQNNTKNVPTFLRTKLYIDFSNDEEIEYAFDELLRTLLNEPLFQKPEIGTNPFAPMAEARPDRTADGIRAAMAAYAEAMDVSRGEWLFVDTIHNSTTMRKLKLMHFLDKCVQEGLMDRDGANRYSVTSAGFDYLFSHGIIDK